MRTVAGLATAILGVALAANAVAAPRLVVGELFTNTYCPPCATYDPALDEWMQDHRADFAFVALHGWWPGYGDVFWQADSLENRPRINYYGADYAPHLRFDGTVDLGSDINPGAWTSALNSRLATSAPLTIDLSSTWDGGTRSGNLSATITNVSGATVSGNFRVALCESLYYETVGGNGYNINNGAVRDLVPSHTGTAISLGAGQQTVVNLPYSLPLSTPPAPAPTPENTQVIAFVQGASREIYQGARLYFPYDGPAFRLAGTTAAPLPGGDGDAYIDPGEGGSVTMTLENWNPQSAGTVSGTLSTTDPYITITDGTTSFGPVSGFGSVTNGGDPFTFTIAPGAPRGYRARFTLTMTTGALASVTAVPVPVGIGSPTDYMGPAMSYYVYESGDVSNPENPAYGWVEISSALGGPGTQILPVDDAVAYPAIGFTFRYDGVNYDSITVSTNGWIAMGRQFGIDPAFAPAQIPGPLGAKALVAPLWCDLNPAAAGSGKLYRYFDAANHRFIIEWDRVSHASPISNKETFQIILLDPAFHPTVNGNGEIIIQYKDVTDPSVAAAGFQNFARTSGVEFSYLGTANPGSVGIADLRAWKITPDAPVATGVAGLTPAGPAILMAASPNPFAASTRVAFRVPARQTASLKVYGVDGRYVSTLFDGVAEAGLTETRWNAKDAAGQGVAPGLYFARLETGGVTQLGKLMVLR